MRPLLARIGGGAVFIAIPAAIGAAVDIFSSMPRLFGLPTATLLGAVGGSLMLAWAVSLERKYRK